MGQDRLSKAERQRLVRNLIAYAEELPRQITALDTAMQEFGEEFDLAEFKRAFSSSDRPRLYNRVQAAERAFARVQNFLTDMAVSGVRLAELSVRRPEKDESSAKPCFDALRDAGVIDAGLCRRLESGQKARSRVEHDYLHTPAGDVHRAIKTVRRAAEEFVGPFAAWIEPYLD